MEEGGVTNGKGREKGNDLKNVKDEKDMENRKNEKGVISEKDLKSDKDAMSEKDVISEKDLKSDKEVEAGDIEQDKKDVVTSIQLSKTNRKGDLSQQKSKSSIHLSPQHESEVEVQTSTFHNIIDIDDDELSSDSDKSVFMEKGYLAQASLDISEDFFEKLGTVPSLSIVELLDKTHKHSIKSQTSTSKYPEGSDIGSFTNPLTGSLLEEEEDKEEEASEVSVEEKVTVHPPELTSSTDIDISEDDELLELIKEEHAEIEQAKKLDDTEVFETYMELEKEHVIQEKVEFDWVAYERERKLQKLKTVTHEFLNDLLREVIDKAEYVDPKDLLRERLDKRALLEDIAKKLEELETEQRVRLFLNRRVSEYFHRKGKYRVFAEDSEETLKHELHRYKVATTRLDQMLAREEEIKENSEEQIEQLEHNKSILKIRNDEKLDEFEQLVRKTFAYHGQRLSMVADSLFRNMAKLRDEVSTVRYALIQKQHTNAVLNEQLKRLEDLGSNLRLQDYECLQTEVQALDKKIEERNADLDKSRIRCNSNLHIMGHLKEKQAMLRSQVKIQKLALDEVLEQKQLARENVFKAKCERKKLREDIKELSFQCGLLDKPALMLDYDNTVQQVKEATVRVETLRYKHDDILRKIEKFEGKCL